MGSSEMNKSSEAKEPKTPPATSQQLSTTSTGTVNPEWSSFQAYSPIPPHGYLAPSPHAHPYVWGVQHMMPPYGTPPHPYVAMYPPGGMYPHPSMPPGSYPFSPFAMPASNGVAEAGNIPARLGGDAKIPEVRENLPMKRSKGMTTGKNNEFSKTSRMSTNGIRPKSGESASEDTSERSDTDSQDDPEFKLGGRRGSFEAEASPNAGYAPQNGRFNAHLRGVNQPMPISVAGMVTTGSQDERELKRQRRKQSNRESARRSRLRKQAECEELAQRADALKEENASLRSEVSRIRSECEKLLSENAALKERLGELPGKEDLRCSRDDETQQTGQEEDVKAGR